MRVTYVYMYLCCVSTHTYVYVCARARARVVSIIINSNSRDWAVTKDVRVAWCYFRPFVQMFERTEHTLKQRAKPL